jgi:hypothetical protein
LGYGFLLPAYGLLRFLVRAMRPAFVAKLLEFKTVGRLLLILRRDVIAILALGALQCDVISWHKSSFQSPPASRTSNAGAFSNRLVKPDRRLARLFDDL